MKMTQKLIRMLALLFVVVQVSQPAFAIDEKPEVVASDATNQVLTVLRENRAEFEKEPQKYFIAVEQVLDPVIAFDQVARGVMGKYAHRATQEQLQGFARTFRDSLVEFYGKAVMTLDPSRLKLTRVDPVAEEQLREYRNRKIRSIPVNLKVSSDRQEYSLSYSMILDNGQWKARNIIVEGINIGVQFRNQFASAMQQYKDVGKVIDNWPAIMKSQSEAATGA